jgi:hypothetical protein
MLNNAFSIETVVSDCTLIKGYMERSGRGLIEVLSRNLSRENEENHEKRQDSLVPGRYQNRSSR